MIESIEEALVDALSFAARGDLEIKGVVLEGKDFEQLKKEQGHRWRDDDMFYGPFGLVKIYKETA